MRIHPSLADAVASLEKFAETADGMVGTAEAMVKITDSLSVPTDVHGAPPMTTPFPTTTGPLPAGREPYQQRVITEYSDLLERTAKLEAFFKTLIYAALDDAEKVRLRAQFQFMRGYADMLASRIAAFK